MAEAVKKKRGRPDKRSVAEEEVEKTEKEVTAKNAAERQLKMDLELLRLTSRENPFRHTVNKRKESWNVIAADLTALFVGEIFDDRRCRERVKILMKARRVEADKKVTGVGSLILTEDDTILNTLIEQEDFISNNATAEKEKEEQGKQLTQAIQRDAVITIKKRATPNDDETPDENDAGSLVAKRSSPKKTQPVMPYKKRKVKPFDEYLEGKKVQQAKEQEIKLDNAAERSIRREVLEFEREKLRLEDAEKTRRFELNKKERERRYTWREKNVIDSLS